MIMAMTVRIIGLSRCWTIFYLFSGKELDFWVLVWVYGWWIYRHKSGLHFSVYIVEVLNGNGHVGVVYTDFTKAFSRNSPTCCWVSLEGRGSLNCCWHCYHLTLQNAASMWLMVATQIFYQNYLWRCVTGL